MRIYIAYPRPEVKREEVRSTDLQLGTQHRASARSKDVNCDPQTHAEAASPVKGSGPEGINAVRVFRVTWLLATVFLSACTASVQSQPAPRPTPWTIGFWVWGNELLAKSA